MTSVKFTALFAFAGLIVSGCSSSSMESPAPTPAVEEKVEETVEAVEAPAPEAPPEPPPTPSGPLGTELATQNWKVTVFAADIVPGSDQAQRIADEGTKFAVLDISACAIPSTLSFDTGDVKLVDSEGRNWTYWNVQSGAVEPNLTKSDRDIPAGECTRGWLTMVISEEAIPAGVSFSDDGTGERLEWVIG